MPDENLNLYGDIAKYDLDGESLLVSGILSTPDKDKQGDIIEPDAMRKALGEFLVNGTSREMHQPIAVGKPIAGFVDGDGNTRVTVKVVDKNAITKIKEGVYKGFSIGAKTVKRIGNRVTELILNDASLVDIPANPKCVFDLVKFDKPQDKCSDPECSHHVEGHTEKCASCKSKMEKSMKCGCGKAMEKGMKKCKSCMEKSEHEEHEHKSMKKMLCLALNLPESTSDEDLQKALSTRLAAPNDPMAAVNATIAKLEGTVGDLIKQSKEATERVVQGERNTIIQKMADEGRNPLKPEGVAYTCEELQKMDLPTLKILAVNSPKLPLQARGIYKGLGTGPQIDPNLKGFAAVEAAIEAQLNRN